ncbi:sulfurtransferase TusA family protein [Gilvimarinus algae]|uniref:Sulfurtransferase TusA family protein n=1 Tax=Gilvimarinus algae TaxID=3058037 RepID=A0ABT8THV6_9GAMM|nr:sulfurtransferase TusA family protein [Gilvimarinus sp. SDUM040014]MDO3382693.1 sulfurtransferase TusA family protein [Gilvimarinus sp. SDUM040014]
MTETSSGSSEASVLQVDACGLRCPMPLLRAKQALSKLPVGGRIKVLATDAGSVRDFRAYAELSEHLLISQSEDGGVYTHVLQKG